jgi:precorrin-6B methylase 1
MTLMQELSHTLSTLPYQGYLCLVHLDRSAEAKAIQSMGKFNVSQVPYGNCDEIVKHLQNVQVAVVIPPANKNKLQHTTCFLEALQKTEVKNVVLLSSLGAEKEEKPHLKEFFQIETMAKEMNFNLCIVR